jgi:hypothetical protein
MKAAMVVVGAIAMVGTAIAQTSPGGPTAAGKTGNPAASSASSTPATIGANPSGSGTSTSGGKDDNGDSGRDKAPGSGLNTKPKENAGKH